MAIFTSEQVEAALNRAADEIAERAGLPDEGARDALNLCVNATLGFLETPGASLDDVIRVNYAEDPTVVLRWIHH